MSHTSGPWEVVKHNHVDDELWLSVNQSADAQNRKEWIAEIKYRTADPERQWSDARLIAAAPDLLKAAKFAIREMVQTVGSERFTDTVDALDAAITKAHGDESWWSERRG